MTPAARRVLRTIRAHRLLSMGDRVVVAVSGGADSVALWHLLAEIEAAAFSDLTFAIAGLVHVHHGLRGAEADEDERFCRELAARAGRPIEVAHVDVGALARASRRSIEATARDVRAACFKAAATRFGATVVATGHTVDDQAETVLLRLLRGAGHRGVSGIRARAGLVVRPLIESRRADVRAYLVSRGVAWREDQSNDDRSIPRNRIRHELLPVVERIAPGGVRALARYAAIAEADEQYLDAQAIEVSRSIVSSEGGVVRLARAALASLPRALARRVVRRAIEAIEGAVGARHLDAVCGAAAADNPAGRLDGPGFIVEWEGPEMTIRDRRPGDSQT